MRWLATVIGVVVLVAATPALADDNAKRATHLFDEGRELAKVGNWAEACAKFQQSLDLVVAVGTQLNLADCLEHEGLLVRAHALFDAAARAEDKLPARAKMARDRADKLAARLVTVVVKPADPTGLTVTIAGATVATGAEIVHKADPGTIEIVATAPGRARYRKVVIGAEGARVVVEIPAAARVETPTDPIDKPAASHRKRSRVYLAIGVGGAGLLAFVAGEALALSARGAYNDELDSGNCSEAGGKLTCTSTAATARIEDANKQADLATAVVIGGAVLVATGVILFVTAPRTTERRTAIVPTATPRSVGVALTGSF